MHACVMRSGWRELSLYACASNSFREKYQRYIRPDPSDPDRKRKALTAVTAKMARVAYAIVKTGVPYRAYFAAAVPSGSIPLSTSVEAIRTS